MKKIKLRKSYIASALALVMLFTCMYVPTVYAANEIDTSKDCSLTLSVPADSAYNQDGDKPELTLNLYKVADVDSVRKFGSSDEYGVNIQDLSTAENPDWQEAAQTASVNTAGKTAKEVKLENGKGTASGLKPGMYLVTMDPKSSPEYDYEMTPYFISLPNNLYYESGEASDDEWIYEAESTIKLAQTPRIGSIQIQKTLRSFNSTLGQTTFVYRLKGTKGTETYESVVGIDFTAAGVATVTVDDIPVGMVVTVTEEYDGASYTATSATEQTVTAAAENIPTASFENEYDGGFNGGYGVVNHFEYNEEAADGVDPWTWTQQSTTGN